MKIIRLQTEILRSDGGDLFINSLDCEFEGWLRLGGFFTVKFVAVNTHSGCRISVKELWPLGRIEQIQRGQQQELWDAARDEAKALCNHLRAIHTRA